MKHLLITLGLALSYPIYELGCRDFPEWFLAPVFAMAIMIGLEIYQKITHTGVMDSQDVMDDLRGAVIAALIIFMAR